MHKLVLIPVLFLFVNIPPFYPDIPPSYVCREDSIIQIVKKIDSLIALELRKSSDKDPLARVNDSLLNGIRGKLQRLPVMLMEKDSLQKYYAGDMEDYLMILDSIRCVNDAVSKQPLICSMHEDLLLKFWFPAMGAEPNNPLCVVKVKLRVMNLEGDRELKGYTGYLKPQLSNLQKNVTSFVPTFENEKNVSPGVKLVWIEKEGKIIQSRVETLRRTMGTLEISFLTKE